MLTATSMSRTIPITLLIYFITLFRTTSQLERLPLHGLGSIGLVTGRCICVVTRLLSVAAAQIREPLILCPTCSLLKTPETAVGSVRVSMSGSPTQVPKFLVMVMVTQLGTVVPRQKEASDSPMFTWPRGIGKSFYIH